MGGTYISPNPQRQKEYIDNDGNKLVGATPTSYDSTIIKRNDQDNVTPPANLDKILEIKEKRLKTLSADELGQFDVNAIDQVPEETLVKTSFVYTGTEIPVSKPSTASSVQQEIEATEKRLAELKELKKQKIEEMKKQLAELEGE